MKYKDLIDNVNKYEKKFGLTVEPKYLKAIGELGEVRDDLNKLDVSQHLRGAVRRFLADWGKMWRVVNRKGLDWKGLGEALRKSEKEFGKLRNESFISINFSEEAVSNPIETIYEKMKTFPYLGGATAISKILHLLNPEIFVIWDTSIRKKYEKKNPLIGHTPEGYLEFLKTTQKEILEALNDCHEETGKGLAEIEQEIRSKYQKTMAKLVDEYNYVNRS
jgi:hypothetical protein